MLAHDLKLCLAQWPARRSGTRARGVAGSRSWDQAVRAVNYPGLRLLTMDALYAEPKTVPEAIVSHGRDYLVSYSIEGEPA